MRLRKFWGVEWLILCPINLHPRLKAKYDKLEQKRDEKARKKIEEQARKKKITERKRKEKVENKKK